MEIRTLRYFLELARRGNFTAAAAALNLTQPTLSKQMQELEEELGTELLIRGKRRTTLTEAGEYLFKNASEIVEMAERTRQNIVKGRTEIGGNVHIAGAETRNMDIVAKAIRKTRERYPGIKFHIYSGNAEAVGERLEKGLADFGTFILPAPVEKFDFINLPLSDRWGLLLRKDDPLASRDSIRPSDLSGRPLIGSLQHSVSNGIRGWVGNRADKLDIVATYNLLYNGALLVEEGVGAALCLDGIANISSTSPLCFRPLEPALYMNMAIAWKKADTLTAASSIFHDFLLEEIVKYRAAGGDRE